MNGATFDQDGWHLVEITTGETFTVRCTPHGQVSVHGTWFEAVIGRYAHDYDFRGAASMAE